MARARGVNVENTFVRGLITEGTGLNFPENAAIESSNVIYSEKIKAIRRLGIDFEADFVKATTGLASLTDIAISEFLWRGASGVGTVVFQVVQIGATLHFYEALEDSLSSGKAAFTTNLATFELTAGSAAANECQFASGDGKLFVVSPGIEPIYITYDFVGDTISATEIDVQIRDFDGVDSLIDTTTRPATLTNSHNYNLRNQGWYANGKVSTGSVTGVLGHWSGTRADYPSLADVWWRYKNSNREFDLSEIDTFFLGNTEAQRGHFIIDAFVQNRQEVSGVTITNIDAATRPSCVAFFAGRVWYAGVAANDFSSNLYFSQIAEKPDQYAKCYQRLDPTSEEFNELLPSDGGIVVIPEIGTVLKLFVVENALFVFASNGIWAISGSEGQGFRANDYAINRVSNTGAFNFKSFVDVNGIPFWWNTEGIYTLFFNPETQKITARSISDDTIKTFLDTLPLSSKEYAKGAYNDSTKVIQWVYRFSEVETTEQRYRYNRVLCFNTITGAFYPYSISSIDSGGPYISGITAIKGLGTLREEEPVIVGGEEVTHLGLTVTAGVSAIPISLAQVFKYLVTVYNSTTNVWELTFAQERDTSYFDWVSYDTVGKDFLSVFLTGYKVHGQGIRKFQANYLRVYMDTEPNASLCMNAVWNYGRQPVFSSNVQCYREDRDVSGVSSKRLKIRGSGTILQLKFNSETGKPFSLIGWSAFESMNQLP